METKPQSNLKKIGALWKKETAVGKTYYSGKLDTGESILVFDVKVKKNDKSPDMEILVRQELTKSELKQVNHPGNEPQRMLDDTEIPF